MTYREFYTAVINTTSDIELKKFATQAILTLDHKNILKRAKGTPTQRENAEIKERIEAYVNGIDTTVCASEIGKKFEISTNKAAALLSQMAKDGVIEVIDGYKPEGGKGKVKGYKRLSEKEEEES